MLLNPVRNLDYLLWSATYSAGLIFSSAEECFVAFKSLWIQGQLFFEYGASGLHWIICSSTRGMFCSTEENGINGNNFYIAMLDRTMVFCIVWLDRHWIKRGNFCFIRDKIDPWASTKILSLKAWGFFFFFKNDYWYDLCLFHTS